MIVGMKRVVKVAISLPEDLLRSSDRQSRARGISRSEFFREALQAHLASGGASDLQRYIDGYSAHSETETELAEAEAASLAVFASLPWD